MSMPVSPFQIGNLEGHFTLRDSRGRPERAALVNTLAERTGVRWVQRQQTHYRDKRAVIRGLDPHHSLQEQQSELPSRRQDSLKTGDQLSPSLTFNDPLWPMQWELFNHGQYSSSHFDLNVMPVWSRNITGNGVVVSIIDDGVDHTNTDLKRNFEALASFDLRGSHGLSHDPHATQRRGERSWHPMCRGSGHGGQQLLLWRGHRFQRQDRWYPSAGRHGDRLHGGHVSDLQQRLHRCVRVLLGPAGRRTGDGRAGDTHTESTEAGHGRGGKGSIFVWASGNGGLVNDHCGADGYVNSVYSIAIGAVTHMGKPAFFGEPCPAVMAVTLTGASLENTLPLVTVSNLGDGCVTHFAGTSSAAPIAAGILALVLEANPDLTWRDVQHLIAMTAKVPDPKEPGWSVNGAGYHVHDRYGFGVLDAGLMVQQALQFQAVAPHRKCTQEVTLDPIRILPSGGEVSVNIQSAGCLGTDTEVNTLEHVQVKVSLSSVCRGDLSIALASPAGTVSLLLATRSNDDSAAGLRNWTLMSVQSWGEHPHGVWTLKVTDNKGTVGRCVRVSSEEAAGAILSVTLLLYGTYNPHRSLHEEPLQSFLSMGAYHHVPRAGLYVWDRYPPQDLIQRAFELERDRKVGTDDIPVPRQRKNSELVHHPVQSFNVLDLDDTDGADLHSHLKLMWNTLRDKVKTNWFLYKSITGNQSPQLRWADIALQNFLGSGPVVGVEPPGMMHKLRDSVGGVTRSSPPQKRTQLLHDVAVDVREMPLTDLLRTSRATAHRADRGQGQSRGTGQ
nr:PC3-like endoprotease variant B [Oncorhynchus nerka]